MTVTGQSSWTVQPDVLELVTGMMLGKNDVHPISRIEGRRPVREVLEEHVRRALLRSPCIVSFSGGRDSSTILALATHVARRDGLPDPIPATLVFPDFPATHEEDWQRIVLDHLGINEWIRLPFKHELELVGPVALDLLAQFGVLFPSNTHLHVPMMAKASGGSLLTGVGGDEVLDSRGHPLFRVVAGHRRLRRSDLRTLPRLAAPPVLRRKVKASRPSRHGITWLTEEAWALVGQRQAEQELPERLGTAMRAWHADRYYCALVDSFAKLASVHDVSCVNPFLDRESLASLSHDAGAAGFVSRQSALQRYVGDLLPTQFLARTSKAKFDDPFHGPATNTAVHQWDGAGFPSELVDADLLGIAMRNGEWATRWSLALQWLVLEGHTAVG